MAFILPRLFVGWERLPDTFTRFWNDAMSKIETNINDILTAQAAAEGAQTSADGAQSSADDAQTSADTAQTAANAANTNANTRVLKDAGPTFGSPSGTISRAAYTVYAGQVVSNPPTQAEVQAIDDALKALSQYVAAAVTDLLSNHALKP